MEWEEKQELLILVAPPGNCGHAAACRRFGGHRRLGADWKPQSVEEVAKLNTMLNYFYTLIADSIK